MKKRYVIASIASREIVRVVTCDEAEAGVHVHVGEVMIESADATPRTHRLHGGEIKPYTQAQVLAKGTRPAWASRWDNAAMEWIDRRSPEDIKAARVEALKASIAELEAAQARPQREALLAIAAGRPIPAGAAARLASIESGVAALLASIAAL